MKDETKAIANTTADDITTDRFKVGARISDEDQKSFPKCVEFLDYKITHSGNSDGWVLQKKKWDHRNMWECHLGNFDKAADAQKAAVHYFMIARPADFATQVYHRIGVGAEAHQTSHDYYKFLDVLAREQIECPKEITLSDEYMSSCLGFNGEAI